MCQNPITHELPRGEDLEHHDEPTKHKSSKWIAISLYNICIAQWVSCNSNTIVIGDSTYFSLSLPKAKFVII